MNSLSWTFGGGLSNEQPLLAAVSHFVGRPVRVRCVDPGGEHWLRGRLKNAQVPDEQVLEQLPDVALEIINGRKSYPLRIATTAPGVVVWSCPRRRILTVHFAADDRRYEIYDDREIVAIDSIERDLVAAMSEPDPMRRFDRLVAMRESVTFLGDVEDDDQLRARLVGLSVFLEEYRGDAA